MNRGGRLPDEEEQYEAYAKAVRTMQGLPTTIRTVDVGADKPLDRMSANELRHEHALNPALGLRAIRWSLSEPAMFRKQLRAIYRASLLGPVRILIPMLGQAAEIRQTIDVITRVRRQLEAEGLRLGPVPLGAMIEVPAAALIVPTFLRHFDFVSIGTNDLIQYTLAIDRADESVAHLYDPWHPAVLRLLQQTIEAANEAGKDVSVCGEMAGDVEFTELLLAMGLRNFSMHPSQVLSIKQVILRADTKRNVQAMADALTAEDPREAWLARTQMH